MITRTYIHILFRKLEIVVMTYFFIIQSFHSKVEAWLSKTVSSGSSNTPTKEHENYDEKVHHKSVKPYSIRFPVPIKVAPYQVNVQLFHFS